MKSFNWLYAIVISALVAGCGGGGGDAGTSPFGSGGSCGAASGASGAGSSCSSATDVELIASSVEVGSGGDTVTITAVVKGTGNVGLSGAPVVFSTTTGTLTSVSATTNAAGVATATFAAGADRSNRTATITARSGNSSERIDVQIVGTAITFSGATTVPLGSVIPITVTTTDSEGDPLANVAVAITSSLNNGLSATSVTTNALGTASFDYTATNSGTDTITLAGAGVTTVAQVSISASQFLFVAPNPGTSVTVNTAQAVTVRYLVNNVPQANQLINFSTTAGVVNPTSATTNAQGQATVAVSATTAGAAVVQATVAGGGAQATLPLNFVPLAAARLVLQASPTAIGPNPAGATAQQSQLRATVFDANNNPVPNVIVSFTRLLDPSGGSLSQASAVSDSGGQATVNYIAGPGTTANNGVQLRASVLTNPAIFGDAQLSVTQSALFIALGTGNVIENLDPQTYKKDWVVYVTDSNGVAVANRDLTIKVLPIEYGKGNLVYTGTVWVVSPAAFTCQNEDFNYNGVLDPLEDLDGSGNLQPGNVILVTTNLTPNAAPSGIARTDSTGRATITLLYAESYAPWVRVRLVAQTTVSGTESSNEARFWVPGESGDFTSATNPPAGVISPFGTNDCFTPN